MDEKDTQFTPSTLATNPVPAPSKPKSDWRRYVEVKILGLVICGLLAGYLKWMEIPEILNKSVADTSVILMGLSMWLSSIGYFWNFADRFVIYRKHLGLIGFGFALLHGVLSWEALTALISSQSWSSGSIKAPLAGLSALVIFTIMAVISNQFSAKKLGGVVWRKILRAGYFALFLALLHVFWLKSARWITWYNDGMERPPSVSLIVTIFIGVVITSRLCLGIALLLKKKTTTPPVDPPQSTNPDTSPTALPTTNSTT